LPRSTATHEIDTIHFSPISYKERNTAFSDGTDIALFIHQIAPHGVVAGFDDRRTKLMRHTIFDTPILSTLLRWYSLFQLKISGWRREGDLPDIPKFVVTAAPHTTNWELPIAIMMAFAYRTRISWLGKDSLFRRPFGTFFKWLGGIPIDRNRSHGMVGQSIEAFQENEQLIMVMAPEGTRSKTGCWKSGFYHIARGADVPIVLGFIDYGRKVCGVGPVVTPTGDIDNDMKAIRAFYADIVGKHPDQSSQAIISATN
jgi:1-acyl-sn-glycerol-3-phosphate acyltransferase